MTTISAALLCSLALHALAAGWLTPYWLKAADQAAVPLTVLLDVQPEPATPLTAPPPRESTAQPSVRRAPARAPLPVAPVLQVPQPGPVAVEAAELAPSAPVSAGPAASPAAVVATAPAGVAPVARSAATPVLVDAAYLVKPQPAYPALARRRGVEGLVLVRVQVSPAGVPEQVSVARSSGTGVLDEEAVRAVREARFEPARRGDIAVAHVVEVPIRFRLGN